MGNLARRYTHVPLGLVTLLLVVGAIAWLVERRSAGVWDPAARIATPAPLPAPGLGVGPGLPAAPGEPSVGSAGSPGESSPAPTAGSETAAPATPDLAGERYALESGPFLSAHAADRREEWLNRLGYATVRFRKQEVTHVYVVAATGFGSPEEAQRIAVELGEGAPVEVNGMAEVVFHRLPSLHEAIEASRPLRERGLQVRVGEETSPTIIYHVRFGQFPDEAAAEARHEELIRIGLDSRVVKVR